MSSYVISNEPTRKLQKVVHKFSREIPINNGKVKGKFTIKRYRKYLMRDEVDVIFEGEIYVNYLRKLDWYQSNILTDTSKGWKVSKIKVNRFIRKHLWKEVRLHLNYFDITQFHSYYNIMKIIWK